MRVVVAMPSMCKAMFKSPKMADPVMPPQYAAQKTPSYSVARQAGDATKARMGGSRVPTLVGGASSYAPVDTTGKKVLLGQ